MARYAFTAASPILTLSSSVGAVGGVGRCPARRQSPVHGLPTGSCPSGCGQVPARLTFARAPPLGGQLSIAAAPSIALGATTACGVVGSRFRAASLVLPQRRGAVAGHREFQDRAVVHDPVDGGGGRHRVAEDAVPLAEDQVRRDQHRPALVPLCHQQSRGSRCPVVASARAPAADACPSSSSPSRFLRARVSRGASMARSVHAISGRSVLPTPDAISSGDLLPISSGDPAAVSSGDPGAIS